MSGSRDFANSHNVSTGEEKFCDKTGCWLISFQLVFTLYIQPVKVSLCYKSGPSLIVLGGEADTMVSEGSC